MILDGIMVSAATVRFKEIEQTFRACPKCKKTSFTHDWIDVTPCAEHKPLAVELKAICR